MPTYEYRCKDCGHELDAYQSFTEDPLTDCPSCQGALKKVFGNVGIAFKGSGFYKTDSRSSANGKTGDSTSGDSGGTDTKPSSDSSSSDSSSPSKGESGPSPKKGESGAKKGPDSSTKSGSGATSGSSSGS